MQKQEAHAKLVLRGEKKEVTELMAYGHACD
jgi:hypothetical protein